MIAAIYLVVNKLRLRVVEPGRFYGPSSSTMPGNVRSKHLTAGLLVVMQCKFRLAAAHTATPVKFYACSFNVNLAPESFTHI